MRQISLAAEKDDQVLVIMPTGEVAAVAIVDQLAEQADLVRAKDRL
jgi:hypothetical protein